MLQNVWHRFLSRIVSSYFMNMSSQMKWMMLSSFKLHRLIELWVGSGDWILPDSVTSVKCVICKKYSLFLFSDLHKVQNCSVEDLVEWNEITSIIWSLQGDVSGINTISDIRQVLVNGCLLRFMCLFTENNDEGKTFMMSF